MTAIAMVSKVLPQHSLKTRITLATLAIFLASLWSLSFFASQMLRRDMERLLGEQLHSTATVLATQINNELNHRLATLNEVAQLSAGRFENGTAALQSFVDGILDRMIFDGEQLGDLMAPLALGWKARTQAELALMADLHPLLIKRAGGRDISGLSAYEQ